ncbi:hypothetical protein JYG23_03095 [Sedimentibacter sp. zth1]|uniref:hypothetical protein n=1 Tax=Sedimentibacter sp. zth1 TaxID=2816908 RepID=UPI001A92341E|nr:hypothetical protein [Sedimentibacter sp. zth1]QSX06461.1 hypothetical protein JYG23_03095 [Sedimentibacter sp. zth1]
MIYKHWITYWLFASAFIFCAGMSIYNAIYKSRIHGFVFQLLCVFVILDWLPERYTGI